MPLSLYISLLFLFSVALISRSNDTSAICTTKQIQSQVLRYKGISSPYSRVSKYDTKKQ